MRLYREADQMMVVSVASRGEFSAGRPRRLFEIRLDTGDHGPNYDASLDGKWFVIPKSDEGQVPGELHLVMNWFSEIKARSQATTARHSTSVPEKLAAMWKAGQ
jgi:hypothetical protein